MTKTAVSLADLPKAVARPVQWRRLFQSLAVLNGGETAKLLDATVAHQDAAWRVVTDELTGSASFSWFDYSVNTDELASGDKLLANTPEYRYTGALNYTGRHGLDLGASFRASTGFPWAAGVFAGWIEPGFTLDATAGYRISNNLQGLPGRQQHPERAVVQRLRRVGQRPADHGAARRRR